MVATTMNLFIFSVIAIFVCVSSNNEVKLAMEQYEVVPDVIQVAPNSKLSVTYEKNKIVDLGNELTTTQIKHEPKVTWRAEPDTYYTLTMVDPDAPSRAEPTLREIRHWLVVNIQGAQPKLGEVIAEYIAPKPGKGAGLHRYVLLLYKQEGNINVTEPNTIRFCTSIEKFADKYGLGEPIAGNFYLAQWDGNIFNDFISHYLNIFVEILGNKFDPFDPANGNCQQR